MMGRTKSSKILQWRKKWCRSGIEGWWQSSLRSRSPRPLSLVTMSVTLMASSCDSIGSCSLDVDAESLADSLIDTTPVDSSQNRHSAGEQEANAVSLSKQTLHSLLLSASTNSSGQNLENTDKSQTHMSSPSAAKKPSYLNLACSISGYGGITTYDSKLREGFRSRDHSPGKLVGIHNGSRDASPARGLGTGVSSTGSFLTAPGSAPLSWTTSSGGSQISKKVDMKHISPTFGPGRRINGSNGTDQTDATGNFNVTRMSDQRNRWLESTLSPLEQKKDYQNVVSVYESTSDRQGIKTETSIETRYERNSRSQSTKVSSTTVISSTSISPHFPHSIQTERIVPVSVERNSASERYSHLSEASQKVYSNGSSAHHTPVSSKSFIQQRVERLYGPCALAQGFFHRGSKSPPVKSSSPSEVNGSNNQVENENGRHDSSSKLECSPELPVLRHLRPEFRDQLAVAPRRSLGTRFSSGSSPSNCSAEILRVPSTKVDTVESIHRLQHQTSTESVADLQPAAPEVVLPQASSPLHQIVNEATAGALNAEEGVPISDHTSHFADKSMDNSASSAPPTMAITKSASEQETENAGHKFLKLQRQTIEKLLELAETAEQEIDASGTNGIPLLSEEALGHLRAAAGQARLLVTQKMVQFEGLCRKYLNQHPDEPFPTTAEDLQGFWDMLLLQVDKVHNTFHHLEKLRAVDWCEEKLSSDSKQKLNDSPRASNTGKKTTRTSKPVNSNTVKSSEAAALRKQREDDRRKLMEQRRKELRQKQLNDKLSTDCDETVEIFGAQPS